MKYYTINKFAKIIGVTPQTLRNWDRSGRLHPHHTSTNGYRYYSEEQLCAVTGIQFAPRKVIGYCRVSSRKQKDDLERQVENLRTYLYAQGNPFEIITDIGKASNRNWLKIWCKSSRYSVASFRENERIRQRR